MLLLSYPRTKRPPSLREFESDLRASLAFLDATAGALPSLDFKGELSDLLPLQEDELILRYPFFLIQGKVASQSSAQIGRRTRTQSASSRSAFSLSVFSSDTYIPRLIYFASLFVFGSPTRRTNQARRRDLQGRASSSRDGLSFEELRCFTGM